VEVVAELVETPVSRVHTDLEAAEARRRLCVLEWLELRGMVEAEGQGIVQVVEVVEVLRVQEMLVEYPLVLADPPSRSQSLEEITVVVVVLAVRVEVRVVVEVRGQVELPGGQGLLPLQILDRAEAVAAVMPAHLAATVVQVSSS
jgi:hypothetical protein